MICFALLNFRYKKIIGKFFHYNQSNIIINKILCCFTINILYSKANSQNQQCSQHSIQILSKASKSIPLKFRQISEMMI